jgi:hypothetical protein
VHRISDNRIAIKLNFFEWKNLGGWPSLESRPWENEGALPFCVLNKRACPELAEGVGWRPASSRRSFVCHWHPKGKDLFHNGNSAVHATRIPSNPNRWNGDNVTYTQKGGVARPLISLASPVEWVPCPSRSVRRAGATTARSDGFGRKTGDQTKHRPNFRAANLITKSTARL